MFDTFRHAAETHAHRPWLSVTPETATAYGIEAGDILYADALEAVLPLRGRYAQAGYGFGHRVRLLLENRHAFFLHWFALNALGCSIVPLNPNLRIIELSYVITHSELVAIVAIPSRHAALRQAAGDRAVAITAPDDPPAQVAPGGPAEHEAALLYTSGTTGRPKGCVLPNAYFLTAGAWYAGLDGLGVLRPASERMLTPLPLFHMNALAYSAMAMLMTGGCLIPVDRFHPRSWWHTVRESGATVIHYLGVMPAILMADPPGPTDRAHDVCFGFGAGVDGKLHAAFEDRFGFPLIEAWAMTETGAGAVIAANQKPRHIGACCFGRPARDIETRIVAEDGSDTEQGEFLVRRADPDPRLGFFRKYLKDPEATAEAWQDDCWGGRPHGIACHSWVVSNQLRSRPCPRLSALVSARPRPSSRCIASTEVVRRCCEATFAARRWRPSLRTWRRPRLPWKRAAVPITGHGNQPLSAMRCASSRRNM